MAKPIHSIVPDPKTLLAFTPERIAGVILEHLNSGDERERASINRSNFSRPEIVQGYPTEHTKELLEVLMEGWSWLEQNLYLIPKPGTSGAQGWYNISRKGREIKTAKDLELLLARPADGIHNQRMMM